MRVQEDRHSKSEVIRELPGTHRNLGGGGSIELPIGCSKGYEENLHSTLRQHQLTAAHTWNMIG